jgi:ElaB/YqjD/DUF883 family membrane-anchored ribosome-binding protein
MESGQKPPEEIRREIVETREELGDTVEAIAEKTDLKTRAKKKTDQTRETAKAKAREVQEKMSEATPEQARQTATQAAQNVRERPLPAMAIAAVVVGGLMLGWMLARR